MATYYNTYKLTNVRFRYVGIIRPDFFNPNQYRFYGIGKSIEEAIKNAIYSALKDAMFTEDAISFLVNNEYEIIHGIYYFNKIGHLVEDEMYCVELMADPLNEPCGSIMERLFNTFDIPNYKNYLSDLHILPVDSTQLQDIISFLKDNKKGFRLIKSDVKDQPWYGKVFIDIPFAYDPYYDSKKMFGMLGNNTWPQDIGL